MQNKVKLKKTLILSITICLAIVILFGLINYFEYLSYIKNTNERAIAVLSIVKEKYPDINDDELLEILLSDDYSSDVLKEYSLEISSDSLIKENKPVFYKYIFIEILIAISPFIISLIFFISYEKKKDKEVNEITHCIEEINKKNYSLNIEDMSEDELSILKNEIYKTTIMLKEEAENSKKDKNELKDSLSDISHQLKTPLTSILIILDNLLEDPDMDKDIREDFIRDIKREIININFLVQSILKLSKLDTNTVHFINEEHNIGSIIDESIKNVSPLCELRNVKVICNLEHDPILLCDYKWQIEAFTNIIKNCIEHAFENSEIVIQISSNNVYNEIRITDTGDTIDDEDIKHIFDRFYKGKNSSHDSIGIGLALAKSIIENCNGNISVESSENTTVFSVKYYKI